MRVIYKYKDSGIEWIGKVPEEWCLKPLKAMMEFVNGAVFKPDEWSDSGIPIIRIENLNGSENYNYYENEMDERYHVREGDLLFGWSGNKGTSFGPYIWDKKGKFFLNQHIFKIVAEDNDTNWLYWTLKAVTSYIEEQTHGIIGMVHITKSDIGKVKVPFPKHEHNAIASFLDREKARIDALIQKKERMIELLKEKRIALITQAITKGLDPNAKMKNSGIEWLGEVPEHWEVNNLKYYSTITMGQSPNSDDYSDDSDLLPFLQGNADFTDKHPLPRVYCGTANKTITEGSILISVRAPVGALNEADRSYGIGRGLCAVKPRAIMNKDYTWYQLHVIRIELDSLATGSTYDAVSVDEVANMITLLPPIKEQYTIATFLDRETAKIDALYDKIRDSITILHEYRTSLIHSAVTGKIDLRDYHGEL